MSTRKRHRAKQNIFRQIWKLTSAIPKWLISWFLRTLLVIGRKPRFAKSGFVLPTTALLLIILALVVGSLIFRSFSRTNQVLAAREQKVIYNAATPAIDRRPQQVDDSGRASRVPAVGHGTRAVGLDLPGGHP